jgi:tyrosyl-tRNA synthetase
MPLLEGLDGVEKMSKSKGNYIGISEAPGEMFGKMMSISDILMWRYYELLSSRSLEDITRLRHETAEGRNPRDAKVALAQEIVARFHSPASAVRALEDFEARFRRGAAPENMPEVALAGGGAPIAIAALLKQAGLVPSTTEAQRSIEQGAVKVDGQRIDDRALRLGAGAYVVQVGKRRWARVTVS